jgi:hypothetical protein
MIGHGDIEGGYTVKLEDRGVNYFKIHDPTTGVNHYIHHGENLDSKYKETNSLILAPN